MADIRSRSSAGGIKVRPMAAAVVVMIAGASVRGNALMAEDPLMPRISGSGL